MLNAAREDVGQSGFLMEKEEALTPKGLQVEMGTAPFNYFLQSIKMIKKTQQLKLVFMVSFHKLRFPYHVIDIHIYDFSGNANVWNGF